MIGTFILLWQSIWNSIWECVEYVKEKYTNYQFFTTLLAGNHESDLSHLQMAVRAIKVSEGLNIQKDESFLSSSLDMTAYMLQTNDQQEIEMYRPYVPGWVYKQYKDGIHVRVQGDRHDCIMMSSLSYWGFHANKQVMDYAIEQACENNLGNHGSYLVTGRNTVVDGAYKSLAYFFKRKYCAISASGFLACMNLIHFLVPKNGLIFIDERAHVCLKFGGKLSGAKIIKFPHNDFETLAILMKKYRNKFRGRAVLVLDAIYSAEGTLANLPEAKRLCMKENVQLIVDEAHSLGTIGPSGRGIEEYYDMVGACDYICGVFSKSLASYGGFVVSNHENVQDLNVTPGVGFATGPQSFSAAVVTKCLEIIDQEGFKVRQEMDELREYYVSTLKSSGITNVRSVGNDIFLIYKNNISAVVISMNMRKKGYLVSAFMFPSVPLNSSTVRLTISPLMKSETIEHFCLDLNDFLNEYRNVRTSTGKLMIAEAI